MKSKNLVTYIAIALFLVGIVTVFGFGDRNIDTVASDNSSVSGMLLVEENNFDFGKIMMQDGDVVHEFTVKNNGSEAVKISKIYTSCMCTTARVTNSSGKKLGIFGMPGHGASSRTNITVGAGEKITVQAIFDPAAHGPSGVGLAERLIYIENNSDQLPKLELAFQATVVR